MSYTASKENEFFWTENNTNFTLSRDHKPLSGVKKLNYFLAQKNIQEKQKKNYAVESSTRDNLCT